MKKTLLKLLCALSFVGALQAKVLKENTDYTVTPMAGGKSMVTNKTKDTIKLVTGTKVIKLDGEGVKIVSGFKHAESA